MPIIRKLTRIGNSVGIILPQPVLEQVGLEVNAEIELSVKGRTISIAAVRYATDEEFAAAHDRVLKKHRKAFERLAK